MGFVSIVTEQNGTITVNVDQIVYVEASGSVAQVHFTNGTSLTTRENLQSITLKLAEFNYNRD